MAEHGAHTYLHALVWFLLVGLILYNMSIMLRAIWLSGITRQRLTDQTGPSVFPKATGYTIGMGRPGSASLPSPSTNPGPGKMLLPPSIEPSSQDRKCIIYEALPDWTPGAAGRGNEPELGEGSVPSARER